MNAARRGSIAVGRDLLGALLILLAGAVGAFVLHPGALRAGNRRADLDEYASNRFVAAAISLADTRAAFDRGDIVVVDARLPEAFENGHIPGALALYDRMKVARFAELRGVLPLGAKVVVVAQNDSDFAARNHASTIRGFGIEKARILEGGMDAWTAAGLPVVSGWDMGPLFEGAVR